MGFCSYSKSYRQ